MQDFKLLTRQLLETYLGSDTLSDVAIQDFLDSNASIIGTGKQEFFKNIEHFLNSFKFDVEKRKNIHFEFKDLEIEENIVSWEQIVQRCEAIKAAGNLYSTKEEAQKGLSDFNDLHKSRNLEEVKRQIREQIAKNLTVEKATTQSKGINKTISTKKDIGLSV